MREPDINSLFCSNVPVKPLNSGYPFWEMLATELEDPEVLCLLETTTKKTTPTIWQQYDCLQDSNTNDTNYASYT